MRNWITGWALGVIAAVLMIVCLAHATTLLILCPEHGVKAAYTGNRKLVERKWYCEYSHATPKDTHKIWSECD